MRAVGTTENAVFVLNGNDVDATRIEVVGGDSVVRQLVLSDLELDLARIVVPGSVVVHRHDLDVEAAGGKAQAAREIRRERRNATAPRDVTADECNGPQGFEIAGLAHAPASAAGLRLIFESNDHRYYENLAGE